MESIWRNDCSLPHRPNLRGEITADAAVIGGGMAGVLTAYLLQKQGVRTVLLEADRLASGQTGKTTAKITAQHGLKYSALMREFGIVTARKYTAANTLAIAQYRKIIANNHIDCDFSHQNAYLYSTVDRASMEKEAKIAAAIGLDAAFVEDVGLPFPVAGGVKFGGQAQFHPLKFLRAITDELHIFERTPVLSIDGHTLNTPAGSVRAGAIVLATHYPFINIPGLYFLKLHQARSYVLALKNDEKLNGMYYTDDPGGVSLRGAGEFVLLGGGGHRTGENRTGGKYDHLRKKAKQLFPDAVEVARWSAQDCVTVDGMPYIGQFSSLTPDRYVATGFGKWGMTGAMVSAMVLCDLIIGKRNPYAKLFSPQRFTPAASGARAGVNLRHALTDLPKGYVPVGLEVSTNLRPGEAKVVRHEGTPVGLYKAMDGKIYAVSARCPHMGCRLTWNPDEQSWDCPCHGSRFDYTGKLLDNPAKRGPDVYPHR